MKELKLHNNELNYLKDVVDGSIKMGYKTELGIRLLKKIDVALTIFDVTVTLLPCKKTVCQNPHERAYRGCDLCKYKKQ